MGQRFIACDRDQSFLMPPDVREWLPPGHLAWFVLDSVNAMDLEAFYGVYRRDGRSRPAYQPAMMVAFLLYAYARGMRSSRAIERACEDDVAFRVIAAQHKPDHATVARFVVRHQDALAGLFGEVLTLCAKAGLAKVGVIAVDGTKLHANASRDENLDYEQSRARSSKRPRPLMPPRTSSTAMRAATSCLSSCGPVRAAGRGCEKPSASSTSSANAKRGRCRSHDPSASRKPSAGSRRSSGPRRERTLPMSITGRMAG